MPDSRSDVLERNLLALERTEAQAARQVTSAYNTARRELLGAILEAWTGSDTLTPRESVNLLRQLGILQQIDSRLIALESELGVILRDIITAQDDVALAALRRELMLLPPTLRPDLTQFVALDTALIEQFVPLATETAQGIGASARLAIKQQLQTGLIQGESFDALARRVFSIQEPSAWRTGLASATRLTRKLVIDANNASAEAYMREAQQDVPELQKQVWASINSRTTQTCLRAHGQIQPIGQPFELTGQPRFARKMQHPAFHWNCRSKITSHHPYFERSGLTTANMRKQADAEIKRRA